MNDMKSVSLSSSNDNGENPLVERIFDSPSAISQGEYTTIYEFLLESPDIHDDPEMIAGALKEFAGWAQYMLERMRKLGLTDQTEGT